MDSREKYQQWLDDPHIDAKTKEELQKIKDNPQEIEDRFYTELEFGTAGLRGVLGAGINRMNEYVVARATEGYANYLLGLNGARERGIILSYDSRNRSREFAERAAEVFLAKDIPVYMFSTLHGVPPTSFGLQYYNCIGGVLITASHNPPEYNGYKVYGENGAQIPPDVAEKVTESILAVSSFSASPRMPIAEGEKKGLFKWIGEEVDKAYYDYVEGLVVNPDSIKAAKDFRLVYTPLNGTGNVPLRKLFADLGIEQVFIVKEQEAPDGNFPTLPDGPNPELKTSYPLALKLAKEKQADLILATDPDADRLGVVVCQQDDFHILSGNQIGSLLGHYLLSQKSLLGTLPDNALVVRSIVTSKRLDAIAQKYGSTLHEVLTGFRYVGEEMASAVQSGDFTFQFGYEEAFGYVVGDKVRDKDAICAALIFLETASYYAQKGMSLLDAIDELDELYGYFRDGAKSFTLKGKEGLAKIQAAMAGLRKNPPAELAGETVIALRDYQSHKRLELGSGTQSTIDLPESNVLYFELKDAWICARPSGTEPKLKIYAEAKENTAQAAEEKCQALLDAMTKVLETYLQ